MFGKLLFSKVTTKEKVPKSLKMIEKHRAVIRKMHKSLSSRSQGLKDSTANSQKLAFSQLRNILETFA